MIEAVRYALACLGAIGIAAGLAMWAEHLGASHALGEKLFYSVAALIIIWIAK